MLYLVYTEQAHQMSENHVEIQSVSGTWHKFN